MIYVAYDPPRHSRIMSLGLIKIEIMEIIVVLGFLLCVFSAISELIFQFAMSRLPNFNAKPFRSFAFFVVLVAIADVRSSLARLIKMSRKRNESNKKEKITFENQLRWSCCC